MAERYPVGQSPRIPRRWESGVSCCLLDLDGGRGVPQDDAPQTVLGDLLTSTILQPVTRGPRGVVGPCPQLPADLRDDALPLPLHLTPVDARSTLHNMHDSPRNTSPSTALALFREYQILQAGRVSRAALPAALYPKEKDMAPKIKVQA